jgi:hypothetical protein
MKNRICPTPSLKEKLIDKLREIEDPALLAELSNLFEIQEPETLYKVSPAQKNQLRKEYNRRKIDSQSVASKQTMK